MITLIGYVSLQLDALFAEHLMKFCSAYHVPFCRVSFPALLEHYRGKPLLAERWDGCCAAEFSTDLPLFLDAGGRLFTEKRLKKFDAGLSSWIQSNCKVLEQKTCAKPELPALMVAGGLSLYAIPTWNISSFHALHSVLKNIKTALIKPGYGRQGFGVFRLKQDENDAIFIQSASGISLFSEEDFVMMLKQNKACRMGDFLLLQPCLDFSLDEGHAVDFRLLRHRGRTGEWEEVATYARIGASSLVSNVSQGGCIADAKEILYDIAKDKADSLYDEIIYIGEALPRLIQEKCGESAFCLGLDIAIDRQSMRPFVLEANIYPGTKYHSYQLAEKRVQFYQYLLENSKK